eukprot:c7868_g1_i1.p1 GENE.c7868_g1_i1~~c7868_g1_i1.p1  ORF type:complete len:276 (-),score=119.43 c7868_g1_i1:39-866(-)
MADRHPVYVGNRQIPETDFSGLDDATINIALESRMMKSWLSGMSELETIVLLKLVIESVDLKPNSNIVNYIKVSAVCYSRKDYDEVTKIHPNVTVALMTKEKKPPIPGICFLRGPSAAVLIVIKGEQEDFTVLTVERCLAVVRNAFPHLPLGQIDETGDFVGRAALELRDSLNLELRELDMVNLTQLAFGNNYQGVVPSAGGCDEYIVLYLYQLRGVSEEQVEAWRQKYSGDIRKDQEMALKIVPLKELWRVSPDSKTLSALAIYQRLRLSGILS